MNEKLHEIKHAAAYTAQYNLRFLRESVTHKLTGTEIMLVMYYNLNRNPETGDNHPIPPEDVMRDLNISRSTLYKAYARLEALDILLPVRTGTRRELQ